MTIAKFTCLNCGKDYESFKETSKYCSRKCRKEYLNVLYKCDYCKKEFWVNGNIYNALLSGKRKHIYCCKECQNKGQVTLQTNVCEHCGKEYKITYVFKDIQKYCSRHCYDEHRRENLLIKICPVCGRKFRAKSTSKYCSTDCRDASMRKRISCTCEHCGKSFERKESEVIKNKRHFCSVECKLEHIKWHPEDISVYSEDVYGWVRKYVRDHISSWRNAVVRESGKKCCITGRSDNLVVHHCRGFNIIMQEAVDKICFQIKDSFLKYKEDELNNLVQTFLELQEKYGEYVCITSDIHKLFHRNYGYGNNTMDQWNEFVTKYNRGKYSEVA